MLGGEPQIWQNDLQRHPPSAVLAWLPELSATLAWWLAARKFPVLLLDDLLATGGGGRAVAVDLPVVAIDADSVVAAAMPALSDGDDAALTLMTTAGDDPLWQSLQRAAVAAGREANRWIVTDLPRPSAGGTESVSPTIELWLREHRGGNVLASGGMLATSLVESANRMGIEIPASLRVICSADDRSCGLPAHGITAVRLLRRELGRRAAAVVDRWIDWKTPPRSLTRIDCGELRVRQTCLAASDHPCVARAVAFIQANAPSGITVTDVLRTLDTSRVTFERHFRDVTGGSPGELIRNVRLKHVQTLLRTTDLPIGEVARRSGFDTLSKLSAFFKAAAGVSPTAYRRDAKDQ